MDAREQRGLLIAALCKITRKDDAFLVPSQSGKGHYEVSLGGQGRTLATCSCPDFEERGEPCKHVYAVQFAIRREMAVSPDGSVTLTESITLTETTTVAPRPTYKQNWTAYNQAQTTEKAKFQELLFELCQGIEEPPTPENKKGRPRNLLRDMAFAVALKVYTGFSARRAQTDLDEAHAKGYMTKSPHYNSVLASLEDPALAPVLTRLIVESSLPLSAVETDFAVDSTGFSSCRFDKWYDHKYGKFVKKHEWVKVHLTCGVQTNVVTAVEIHGKDAGDSPQLPVMIATTREGFTVREVSADKAYLSAENVEAIHKAGAMAFIAIKKNTAGGVGGVFERMYHRFCLDKEAFMAHYHKRSNVESTVSMIKTKFGDSVRSKTDAAMKNEALAKILCHNLCCLIASMFELGVAPLFWGQDEAESVAECPAIELSPVASEFDAWACI